MRDLIIAGLAASIIYVVWKKQKQEMVAPQPEQNVIVNEVKDLPIVGTAPVKLRPVGLMPAVSGQYFDASMNSTVSRASANIVVGNSTRGWRTDF